MTKADFTIPYKGLSTGNHSFDFIIGKQFFESFEYFEGIDGNLNASLELLKEPNLMDFSIHLQGEVNLQCDLCLDIFKQSVEGDFKLIVKFGETFEEESDEVIILPLTENRIDLSQYFFEYINMLIPLQKIHPDKENGESGCDPKMIEQLNQYSEQKEDPRWEVLKKLKLK
jgi:uncharacterized metal-binding protein YceD (DUF177 family)